MATRNMVRDPMFQILSFALPKIVTPLNISWEVLQLAYVSGILFMQLLFKFLYGWWVFPDELVRVEEKMPSLLFMCCWIICQMI